MTANELRQKYLDFFVKRGHKIIPNVSLIPENDPTALFISAGMHPLAPYLLGEPHPLGKRLASNQRCLRTGDIDAVGDAWHITFFEMLGNWSLGDYWKEEAIRWSKEFLIKELGISLEKISVTVFKGDAEIPSDEESAKIWQKEGIPKERIYPLGKADNFWGPVGNSGPCGPCTEMFYDTGKARCGPNCRPGCFCGKYAEIWNDVFMEYNKTKEGEYKMLTQKNVDTGMGVERTIAVLQGKDNIYETELFQSIIQSIERISGKNYQAEEHKKPMRIMADHIKAAAFIIADGVLPGKIERGYVLRRLIRRAIDQATEISYTDSFQLIFNEIINIYKQDYPELDKNKDLIIRLYENEREKYYKTISVSPSPSPSPMAQENISGEEAFKLYSTHGLSPQQLRNQGYEFDQEEFDKAFAKHQEISRAGAEKKFAGGLADHSEEVTRLHTATHLLHAALRKILGKHVQQKGSNITAERLRFDFTHPQKLTAEELQKIEDLVNQKIKENLEVKMEIMTLEEAKKAGALGFFEEKYQEKVKVYFLGEFSQEICGGPHVDFTGTLGSFKIIKEEAAAAGIRRIYATLNPQ